MRAGVHGVMCVYVSVYDTNPRRPFSLSLSLSLVCVCVRERARERSKGTHTPSQRMRAGVCVCVCVCVWCSNDASLQVRLTSDRHACACTAALAGVFKET